MFTISYRRIMYFVSNFIFINKIFLNRYLNKNVYFYVILIWIVKSLKSLITFFFYKTIIKLKFYWNRFLPQYILAVVHITYVTMPSQPTKSRIINKNLEGINFSPTNKKWISNKMNHISSVTQKEKKTKLFSIPNRFSVHPKRSDVNTIINNDTQHFNTDVSLKPPFVA